MNPDLLRSEFLGVTVRFDTVDLPRDELAAFFADVSSSYGLTRFEYPDDDGATMSDAEGAELVLKSTHAACGGVTHLGYREGRQRTEGLLGGALEHFDISQIWLDDITLVASWDLEEDDAGRTFIIDDVVRFDADRLAMLGEGDDSMSLGLRLWRTLGDGNVDCSIEPMHADRSRIYVRLLYSQMDIETDFPSVLSTMDDVNAYLRGPVRSFMMAVARQ